MLPRGARSEEAHLRCRWSNFAQELESLLPHLHSRIYDDAGDVAAGAREAVGEARGDGVIHHSDDWDWCCACLMSSTMYQVTVTIKSGATLTTSFASSPRPSRDIPLPECRSMAKLLPST